ncbi:MAG TPA: SCO family protein [Candidatus Binatia bacterium]
MKSGFWREFSAAIFALAISHIMAPEPARSHEEKVAPIAAHNQPEIFKNIGIEQKLGTQLPLKTTFRDQTGASVSLQGYLSEKPAVLVFSYFDCPMLCPLVLEGLVRSLKPLSLDVGRDFDVLVISIDERDGSETAREKQVEIVNRYGRAGSDVGWHFLTGEKSAIEEVTRSAGFTYAWDEASKQYVHASGIFVLTPQGEIARVLYGIDYTPRDIRLALVEAGDGTIGSAIDQLLLYCYHYNPLTGKYGFVILGALRLAGVSTVLAMATFIITMLRRERRGSHPEAEA